MWFSILGHPTMGRNACPWGPAGLSPAWVVSLDHPMSLISSRLGLYCPSLHKVTKGANKSNYGIKKSNCLT